MPILNIQRVEMGVVGVEPAVVYILTDDTIAEITTAGYLNKAIQGGADINDNSMCLVSTKTSPSAQASAVGWYDVSYDVATKAWSLNSPGQPGSVTLPTTANHMAVFSNATGNLVDDSSVAINGGDIQAGLSGTAGTLTSYPATAAKGSLILTAVANTGDTDVTISNAAHGQATVISIPDGGQATTEFIIADSAGTQAITSGSLSVSAGNITAGASGAAGYLASFPTTASKGSLRVVGVANDGDTLVTISNAAMGQASVVSIPDPGAATAVFTLAASQGDSGKVLTSAGADAVATWETPGGGLAYSAIAGTSQTAVAGTIYIVSNAGQTTITLPAVCAVGDVVGVVGTGAAGWILDAPAGDVVNVGQSATSAGGTVTSAANYDCIQVVCTVANDSWVMTSSVTAGFTIA